MGFYLAIQQDHKTFNEFLALLPRENQGDFQKTARRGWNDAIKKGVSKMASHGIMGFDEKYRKINQPTNTTMKGLL